MVLLCHQSACVQACPIDQKQGQDHPEKQSSGQWQPPSHGETICYMDEICGGETEKNSLEDIAYFAYQTEKILMEWEAVKLFTNYSIIFFTIILLLLVAIMHNCL